MTNLTHDVRFPGEGAAYRQARNELLEAEFELRQKLEAVAALRRKLPLGGKIKEDYVFTEQKNGAMTQTKLSDLFEGGKDSLVVYSYMFGPNMAAACPSCTSMLDGLEGQAPHISQQVNLAVVAKSPIERVQAWAAERGWRHLRLLSSANNSYNSDYHAETTEGHQIPACNVFTRTADGIYHFYATEMLYAPIEGHPRHVDLLWPLWNVLDLTPEGRGETWGPALWYE